MSTTANVRLHQMSTNITKGNVTSWIQLSHELQCLQVAGNQGQGPFFIYLGGLN